jgi:hypothetical protein
VVRDIKIREEIILKTLKYAIAAIFLQIIFVAVGNAQPQFDAYFGMGTASDGSTHEMIDATGSGFAVETPALDGVYGVFGGAVFLKPKFGVGAQVTLRFKQGDYAGLGYRPIFYDFNGIWKPNLTKRVTPEFQAGFGGVNLRLYDPSTQYYDYNTGRYTTFIGSSNHLQLHLAAGVRISVKRHIFLRPQVDYHYVRNLSDSNTFPRFSSNSVPTYTIAIGFSSAE